MTLIRLLINNQTESWVTEHSASYRTRHYIVFFTFSMSVEIQQVKLKYFLYQTLLDFAADKYVSFIKNKI